MSNQNEKHTSQPLTAARMALRPRERLKLPRMKKGNPSDSKAETGNDIVYQETLINVLYVLGRYLYVLGRGRSRAVIGKRVKLDGN